MHRDVVCWQRILTEKRFDFVEQVVKHELWSEVPVVRGDVDLLEGCKFVILVVGLCMPLPITNAVWPQKEDDVSGGELEVVESELLPITRVGLHQEPLFLDLTHSVVDTSCKMLSRIGLAPCEVDDQRTLLLGLETKLEPSCDNCNIPCAHQDTAA